MVNFKIFKRGQKRFSLFFLRASTSKRTCKTSEWSCGFIFNTIKHTLWMEGLRDDNLGGQFWSWWSGFEVYFDTSFIMLSLTKWTKFISKTVNRMTFKKNWKKKFSVQKDFHQTSVFSNSPQIVSIKFTTKIVDRVYHANFWNFFRFH